MSTTKLSDWLDGEEFYERCMDIRSAVLPKDAHREFEGLQQAILRIASQEPRPAGVIGYEDRNGAVREIPADCQAFGAGGMPAALWVGDVRYVPVSVFADGAKPEAPVSDEQIAKAVRPLYSTDEAAEMGLADDIRTVRAVLADQAMQRAHALATPAQQPVSAEAKEVERLKDLADSEGTRAVNYLRRARKAESLLRQYVDRYPSARSGYPEMYAQAISALTPPQAPGGEA